MGSGASKAEITRLTSALAEKDDEINRLKSCLSSQNKIDVVAEPMQTINSNDATSFSKATDQKSVRRSTMGALPSQPLGGGGNILDKLMAKRRIEVSAEVMHKSRPTTFQQQSEKKPPQIQALILSVVEDNSLFQGMDKQEREEFISIFKRVEKPARSTVIAQGDEGDYFYIVEKGELEIFVKSPDSNKSDKVGVLTAEMGFGELALLCNTPRAATVKSVDNVVLWALSRVHYREICEYYRNARIERAREFLKGVKILVKLSASELDHLAAAMEWEEYDKGTTIVREGEVGEVFYLIESGEVEVSKMRDNKAVIETTLKPGEYFGEKALLHDETRQATCTATTATTCLSLSREYFSALLGSLQELMDRENEPEQVKIDGGNDAAKYHMDIGLEDLEILRTLGCGAFGRVRLVKHRPTGNTYALKCLSKNQIVSKNLQQHVVNERKVMSMLDHPFILRLHNTYKDERYIYFLLELALGGELFTHLRRLTHFTEAASRFFVASVVFAFEHIHSKAIVYRDLKPENLILDSDGYLKVVDFGLAKIVEDRTWTLCGTPDYLAPEIILNKGHTKAVDYWALGILIYELTSGCVPFLGDDPMEVYYLVLAGNIQYPPKFSRPLCDLISKLLCQQPMRRLGNMKHGIRDIFKHKWFSGFDWDGLLHRRLTPPIPIKVRDNLDASNFDSFRENNDLPPICDWDPEF